VFNPVCEVDEPELAVASSCGKLAAGRPALCSVLGKVIVVLVQKSNMPAIITSTK